MMSEDLSRRMLIKKRAFIRRHKEKAMQRQDAVHHGRELLKRVREAAQGAESRNKVMRMSLRGL